jgi:hypothetical protein
MADAQGVQWYCRTCLEPVEGRIGGQYQHAGEGPYDHRVVDVQAEMMTPIDSADWKCDFCSGQPVVGDVLVGPGEIGMLAIAEQDTGRLASLEQTSSDDWAACGPCFEMIGKGEWHRMTTRAVKEFGRLHGPVTDLFAAGVASLHEQVRKNMVGLAYLEDPGGR